MSINRRPLHFFSLMLLLLVAFALRQQSSSDEADSAVASVAPSSELAPEVHSVTVATDSLLLVREDGHEPLPVGQGGTLLRRVGYLTSYDATHRLPRWVAWCLTAEHTTGLYKRQGVSFAEDEEVPAPRATDADYYRSGYDRGHICPSGDNRWSEEAQRQSFLFTNICPQVHGLNAGDWNEMEQQCRKWAETYGKLFIVSGPILYKGQHKTIGKNKVTVPEAFFKVVLRLHPSPAAVGCLDKDQSGNRPKGDYMNTVDEVERITSLDFFSALPDSIEERVEVQLGDFGI